MTLTGQCRCANVTYTLNTDAPLAVYACHCQHCQTWSGSAFALHALLPADTLKVDGVLTEYGYDVEGQRSEHHLCGVCHTRIYNTTTAAPGLVVLRVGTLDESPAVQPVAHIWVRHKQPWVALAEGVPTWPQSPTPQAFAQVLSEHKTQMYVARGLVPRWAAKQPQ